MAAYPNIAFILEGGQGHVDSTTYADLTFANQYMTQMGYINWTALPDTSIQQMSLNKATQAIDILYGQEFYGIPRSQGPSSSNLSQPYLQGLLYPRFTQVINQIQVLQTGYIPVQLKKAVCEVAYIWTQAGGGAGNDSVADQAIYPQPNLLKFIRNKQTKVGGIATSVTYGMTVEAERYPGFWKVDRIMFPLLKKSNNPMYMSL